MKVKILLENEEDQYQAESILVKSIQSKYDVSRKTHPDPVVEEITNKLMFMYNKEMISMMGEILEVLKMDNNLI